MFVASVLIYCYLFDKDLKTITMNLNVKVHKCTESNFLFIEMYIRGNGRDLTLAFDNDPNFFFATVNLTISKENNTISATFLESCKYKFVLNVLKML